MQVYVQNDTIAAYTAMKGLLIAFVEVGFCKLRQYNDTIRFHWGEKASAIVDE
jgi:hypothetical protein